MQWLGNQYSKSAAEGMRKDIQWGTASANVRQRTEPVSSECEHPRSRQALPSDGLQGNERGRDGHAVIAEADLREEVRVNRVTPQVRHLAECLSAQYTQANKSRKTDRIVFRACETLLAQLGELLGNAACVSLFMRAVALAARKAPRLSTLRVSSDGSVEMAEGSERRVSADAMAAAEVVVLAELLGLLVTFIGETLTLQMVHEAWPRLPPHELDFSRRTGQ